MEALFKKKTAAYFIWACKSIICGLSTIVSIGYLNVALEMITQIMNY